MALLPLLILSFLSITGHTGDWATSPFVQPRVLSLPEMTPLAGADRELPVTVIMLRDSQWTAKEILQRWQRVREILKPCRIDVRVTNLIEAGLPTGIKNVYAPNDQEIARLLPIGLAHPVAFFTGGNVMQTYLDEFAEGSPRRSLIGTIWIGDLALTEAYNSRIQADYEVVAHEVGHVLGIDTHVRGRVGNLMSGEPGYGNSSVTKDQCELFRTSGYLRPLN